MTREYIRIADLISQEKLGTISENDRVELLNWIDESEAHRQLYNQILENYSFRERLQGLQKLDENKVWRKIERQINPISWINIWRKLGYAASVLLVFSLSYYLYIDFVKKEKWPEFTHVIPGKQNAVLRLATGECLELLPDNKIIQEEANGKIEQIEQLLVYQMQNLEEEQYNTLEVPNSGEFQLVLSDGTHVWLNAGTKLTYPVAFVKGERKVYLEGEAYFEVAKNEKKPFFVHTNGMDIRVLGTSFNLKSFTEDNQAVITLVKGKVEVKTHTESVVLLPEQQAEFLVDKNQLMVRKADLKSVLAWKNDMFIFKDASLEYMMKELGRWFDVDVEFESEELKSLRVYIYIERSKTLKDVLDKITSIDGIKWRIEKKKIILESDKN